MDIVTLFFIFVSVVLFGIVGSFINMAVAVTDDNPFENMRGTMIRYVFFGLFWIVGGIGTLITGAIWCVQNFSS